jgi:hypothetical protein
MRCAALGHQPGTDEFHLIPRKIKGRPTVQGIKRYRGIVERMYRSVRAGRTTQRKTDHGLSACSANSARRTGSGKSP